LPSFAAELLADAITHWSGVGNGLFFTKASLCASIPGVQMPKQFWHASILKRDSPTEVDFSGIAAERAARVLLVICATFLFRKCNQPDACRSVERVVEKWIDDQRAPANSELDRSATGRLLKRALVQLFGIEEFGDSNNDANKFPLAFAAKWPGAGDGGLTKEHFRQYLKARYKWIWKAAGG